MVDRQLPIPSYGDLLRDLRRLRKSWVIKHPSETPALRQAAALVIVGDQEGETLRIRSLLGRAADRLSPPYGKAVLELLGVFEGTVGVATKDRQVVAANTCGTTLPTFQKTFNNGLLDDLCGAIVALLDESKVGAEAGLKPNAGTSTGPVPAAGEELRPPERPSKRRRRRFTSASAVTAVFLLLVAGAAGFSVATSPGAPLAEPISGACPSTADKPSSPPPTERATTHPVYVALQEQPISSQGWAQVLRQDLRPGQDTRFLLTYRNQSKATQYNVAVGANLPPRTRLIHGSTCLYNSTFSNGMLVGDHLNQGGINIGNYLPGATAYITFVVTMPPAQALICGKTDVRTVGVVQPPGEDAFYDTAEGTVSRACSTSGASGSVSQVVDTLKAQVRLPGEGKSSWRSTMRVPAGDPVEWSISFVHGSISELSNVVLLDEVPVGVIVVPGSVHLYNGNYPTGYTMPSSAVQANGTQVNLNLGDYLPLSDTAVANGLVSAQVVFDTEFAYRSPSNCAPHTITNNVWVGTQDYPRALRASASALVSC